MTHTVRLTVLGVGNELMGDDGIGIRVVRALREQVLPDDVELIDAGVGGLNLLNVIERAEAILAIDAAEMNMPPGSYRWVSPEQLRDSQGPFLSLHDTSFAETLWLTERFFARPPTTIFAIQPASVEPRLGLSPPLAEKLPELVHAVCDSLWQRHRAQSDH
jgi:hydrogenase maturation protease